jgi:oligosaccharide repeat unit polymerase
MSAEDLQERETAQIPAEPSPVYSLAAIMFFGPVAIILTGLVWFWPDSDPITPLGCLFLSLLFFGIHLALCGRRLGSFDPGFWIPILMILHYFGMVVPVELIPNSGYYTYDTYNYGLPQVARGFAMALDVFVLYILGFHLLPTLDLNRRPDPPMPAEKAIAISSMILMLGGTAMMVIGIPLTGAGVVFGAYGEMKEAAKFGLADFRLIGAGFLFAAGGTYGVLATIDRFRSTRFQLAVACAAFIFVFLVLTGDRTGMSLVIFSGGWALTQRVTRIPRWIVVGGFCFMFLLMPMIKEYREYRDVEETQSKSTIQLASATFYEMGSSVQIHSFTIDRIPSEKDFNWGKSILVQIMNTIPNFAGQVGFSFMSFDPLEYDPSKWVTWTASPNKYYNAGGGFGYAVGAEWYFNFGFPGMFFGMIWMGWLTAFMRNRSRKNTMWLIVACLYFGLLVTVVRNDIGYPLRTMMWPLVGYWILNFILRHTASPKGRPIDWGADSSPATGTFDPATAPNPPAAVPWSSQDR